MSNLEAHIDPPEKVNTVLQSKAFKSILKELYSLGLAGKLRIRVNGLSNSIQLNADGIDAKELSRIKQLLSGIPGMNRSKTKVSQ